MTNGVYATGGRDVEETGTSRVVIDKGIRVESINGPAETLVVGEGGIRCVYLGTNAVLSGFTLTNGHAGEGGGVWCESGGAVNNCVITGNSTIDYGGGGGAFGGTIYNCTFTGNSTRDTAAGRLGARSTTAS